jgi:hypothetical protein
VGREKTPILIVDGLLKEDEPGGLAWLRRAAATRAKRI